MFFFWGGGGGGPEVVVSVKRTRRKGKGKQTKRQTKKQQISFHSFGADLFMKCGATATRPTGRIFDRFKCARVWGFRSRETSLTGQLNRTKI